MTTDRKGPMVTCDVHEGRHVFRDDCASAMNAPTPSPPPTRARCTATTHDRATGNETRCALSTGHDGDHDDGALLWRPAAPDQGAGDAIEAAIAIRLRDGVYTDENVARAIAEREEAARKAGIEEAAQHAADGFVLIPAAAQWADKRRLLADSIRALSARGEG